MTGRPTIRTEAIVESILDQIGDGIPLAQVCRQEGMPKLRTWYDWCEADPDLSARVARARLAGHDNIALDALRIADTPAEGVIEKLEPVMIANPDNPDLPPVQELQVVERRVEDMLGHRKLQVETRLKLLRCWDPKRYGDRLELDGKVDANVSVAIKRFTPGEAEPA